MKEELRDFSLTFIFHSKSKIGSHASQSLSGVIKYTPG